MEHLKNIAFLDVETTGLSPSIERVIELGVIVGKINGRGLIVGDCESRCSFIDPEMPIPSSASHINNIYDHMVKGKPKFKDIIKNIMRLIPKGSVLVAHNAPFDMNFLASECNRVDVKAAEWIKSMEVIDTLPAYRKLFKGRATLAAMCERFGIDIPTNAHRALTDAHMLKDCYDKWALTSPLMMIPELAPQPMHSVADTFILQAHAPDSDINLLECDAYDPCVNEDLLCAAIWHH